MARPRKPSAVLHSIEECDAALRRMLAATLRLERLSNDREAAMLEVNARYEKRIAEAGEEIRDLTCQLQHYYLSEAETLERDGRRSLQLYWGVIGRRLSPPSLRLLNKSWTWSAVMARLRDRFGARYLRVKEPEVDKEAVKSEIAPERLKEFGLRLESEEQFFAEPNRDRASELL